MKKPYYDALREAVGQGTSGRRVREIFREMKEKYPTQPDIPQPGLKEALPTIHYYTEFVKAYREIRFRQPSLEEFRNALGRIRGYMPRIRPEGDYYIRVYVPNDNGVPKEVRMEKAPNRIRAGIIKTRLQEDPKYKDATVEVTVQHDTPESVFQQISGDAVEALIIKAIERARYKQDITATDARTIRENLLRNRRKKGGSP